MYLSPRYIEEYFHALVLSPSTPVYIIHDFASASTLGEKLLRVGKVEAAFEIEEEKLEEYFKSRDMIIGISAEEFAMDYNYDVHSFYLVDVRPLYQSKEGHVQGADLIPIRELLKLKHEFEPRDKVYVYGRDLDEALIGAFILKRMGALNVRVVTDPFEKFFEYDIPIVRTVHV